MKRKLCECLARIEILAKKFLGYITYSDVKNSRLWNNHITQALQTNMKHKERKPTARPLNAVQGSEYSPHRNVNRDSCLPLQMTRKRSLGASLSLKHLSFLRAHALGSTTFWDTFVRDAELQFS